MLSPSAAGKPAPARAAAAPAGRDGHGDASEDASVGDAADGDPGEPEDDETALEPLRWYQGWSRPLLIALSAVVALMLTQAVVAQPFLIPSGSMENTLLVGDRILVNKLAYAFGREPQRGDVIVFDGRGSFVPETSSEEAGAVERLVDEFRSFLGYSTADETDFVKRIVGLPGDRVVCCDSQGRITVNGTPLEETSTLFPGDAPSNQPFDVIVPAGRLWVMGDHRSSSRDSRDHLGDPGGGFVPVDAVIGRAEWIIYPVSRWTSVQRPDTYSEPGPAGEENVEHG
ncbi:signal peptidase I [Allostreptomyces psammosilenae]|uniref:signal peptidase I n=1 Tax=Allostreptomyces psammosilenae TaxID=1892865 RepID=UPI00406BA105